MNKSLIILDWDNTLFPTTFVNTNKINLTTNSSKTKLLSVFAELDNLLYKLFQKILNIADLMIITNASLSWINMSSFVLPNTRTLFPRVKIYSARNEFQNSSNMDSWKINSFKKNVNNNYQNIISIGDALFEYNALVKLYFDNPSNKRFLKTIKLLEEPSFDKLIDQLGVIYNAINDIVATNSHLDLILRNK
jgi:hypothetical protein